MIADNSKPDMNKLEAEAVEIARDVVKEVELTDGDKEQAKVKTAKAKPLSDKQFASELLNDLNDFIQDKVGISTGDGDIDRLPTGVKLLDAILGGGFGLGTFSQIIGAPGTFKSALLAQVIAQAQLKYKGKILQAYYDSETAMTSDRLKQMGVVNPPIKPFDDKVTVEKIFKTIETFSAFKKLRKLDYPGIVGWDSIANTSVEKEFTTDDINSTIGLKARILSSLLPRYVSKLRENDISLIAINQLREKLDMGMFGSPNDLRWMGDKIIPGGQAIKYNAFHMLFLKARSDLDASKFGFNGLLIEAKCIKNKFERPNIPIELIVDFKSGVSDFWTSYNYLGKTKRMQCGAWNFLKTLSEKKFRTKDAKDLYDSDKDFSKEFDKQIKEAIDVNLFNDIK
jgi:RecA/RadA recombinase